MNATHLNQPPNKLSGNLDCSGMKRMMEACPAEPAGKLNLNRDPPGLLVLGPKLTLIQFCRCSALILQSQQQDFNPHGIAGDVAHALT